MEQTSIHTWKDINITMYVIDQCLIKHKTSIDPIIFTFNYEDKYELYMNTSINSEPSATAQQPDGEEDSGISTGVDPGPTAQQPPGDTTGLEPTAQRPSASHTLRNKPITILADNNKQQEQTNTKKHTRTQLLQFRNPRNTLMQSKRHSTQTDSNIFYTASYSTVRGVAGQPRGFCFRRRPRIPFDD